MHDVFDALMDENNSVGSYFAKGKVIWKEILDNIDLKNSSDAKSLADQLYLHVDKFRECGDYHMGKEIMAITGVLQFYNRSKGWEEKEEEVISVYNAIQQSSCPIEVKQIAKTIAQLYYLDIDDN